MPKIPSIRITDLAAAMAPGVRTRTIGIRPGEKLHEVMCPQDDSHLTIEFDDHYVIQPTIIFGGSVGGGYATNGLGEKGVDVPQGYEYNSGTNPQFLGVEALRQFNKVAGAE